MPLRASKDCCPTRGFRLRPRHRLIQFTLAQYRGFSGWCGMRQPAKIHLTEVGPIGERAGNGPDSWRRQLRIFEFTGSERTHGQRG